MMKNYDQSVEINHNPISHIPDYPYRILIIVGSGSGKTNVLLNLMKHQRPDINKYLFIRSRSINYQVSIIINGKVK